MNQSKPATTGEEKGEERKRTEERKRQSRRNIPFLRKKKWMKREMG